MNIEEDHEVPLILGRPFMKTTRIMIDADNGQMKVRVQDVLTKCLKQGLRGSKTIERAGCREENP